MLASVSRYNTGVFGQDRRQKINLPSFKARVITPEVAHGLINKIKSYNADIMYVIGHSSLDDDALSSAIGWSNLLRKCGINSKVCTRKEQTKKLYASKWQEVVEKCKKTPALILSVDFNDTLKIPKLLKNMFNNTPIVGVDHHLDTKKLSIGNAFYIDESAKSCSGIIIRMFDALGQNLDKRTAEALYCGMLSDYSKSNLVKIKNGEIIKLQNLYDDKNSLEVLEKAEKLLDKATKDRIHMHLDVMSRLTPGEKAFYKKLPTMLKFSPNSKFAYVAIDPDNDSWRKIGMDNDTTSTMLRNFRIKILNNDIGEKYLTKEQKDKLNQVKSIAVFFRTSPKEHGVYAVSLHSKESWAEKLMTIVNQKAGQELGWGHPNRMGARIRSLEKDRIDKFINYFIEASEQIE